MDRKTFYISCLLAITLIFLNVQIVLAHETITVGDYELEVGWLNEPPVAGQENAIVVRVINTAGGVEQPVEDVAALTVTVSYGGQSKVLSLQPLGEDTPGQFSAALIPTLPGEYEIEFGGNLEATSVDVHTHVEEVQSADTLEFPVVEVSNTNANNGWLVWLSMLVGLIGVGLGVTALRRGR